MNRADLIGTLYVTFGLWFPVVFFGALALLSHCQ